MKDFIIKLSLMELKWAYIHLFDSIIVRFTKLFSEYNGLKTNDNTDDDTNLSIFFFGKISPINSSENKLYAGNINMTEWM